MSAAAMGVAKAALFQQLATAVRRAIPVAEVVRVLVDDDAWPRRSRAAIRRLADGLEQGDTLGAAMAREATLFAPATTALVEAAQASSPEDCAAVLQALAADARREGDASRRIAGALDWPLALVVVLMVVMATWSVWLAPTMQDSFDSMQPGAYRPSVFLASWWIWLPALYALALAWRAGWLPAVLRDPLDAFLDGFGFIGRWHVARFAGRLLDWLAACDRMPQLRAPVLAHLRATAGSPRAARVAHELAAALEAGTPPGAALAAIQVLPARLGVLVKLGERTGNLPEVLADLRHDAAEDEALAFARFERGCVLASYLAIGVLVGNLLVGVYLPIFKLGTIL